jgi:hypothetical protein
MKLIIEAHFYIVYGDIILRLKITAEVIVVYDEEDGAWRFDINYN